MMIRMLRTSPNMSGDDNHHEHKDEYKPFPCASPLGVGGFYQKDAYGDKVLGSGKLINTIKGASTWGVSMLVSLEAKGQCGSGTAKRNVVRRAVGGMNSLRGLTPLGCTSGVASRMRAEMIGFHLAGTKGSPSSKHLGGQSLTP